MCVISTMLSKRQSLLTELKSALVPAAIKVTAILNSVHSGIGSQVGVSLANIGHSVEI